MWQLKSEPVRAVKIDYTRGRGGGVLGHRAYAHFTIGGALIRDESLPRHVEKAASRFTVVIILRCVGGIVNGPVAPRAPRAHQVLFRRPTNCDGRVKLGYVHVRAHTVRVLGAHKISPPEALTR